MPINEEKQVVVVVVTKYIYIRKGNCYGYVRIITHDGSSDQKLSTNSIKINLYWSKKKKT